MGVQRLMLLSILLFLFCTPASRAFSPVSKSLVSENINAGRGGGGGGEVGGDGGQSNSSPQGGGNAVVPVYTAGAAAGQRRNHKGAAPTCTPCWIMVLIFIATSASLLLHIPM